MTIEEHQEHLLDIMDSIQELDLRKDEVMEPLENINKLFSMGIDFEEEWRYFINKGDFVTV